MKLAYIMLPSRGGTDTLLAEVAENLTLRGLRPCGTVQVNTERMGSRHCDMDLMVLPDGPAFRISQNRGEWARGVVWMRARWKWRSNMWRHRSTAARI